MASKAPISREGHKSLLHHIIRRWDSCRGFYASEFLPKLWAIDKAYYVYKEIHKTDPQGAASACSTQLTRNGVTLPIAVADADTAISELADTFLTGNPIFGVVAPPDQMAIIPVWEALFQYYSITGNWHTALFNCFQSGIRYNMPILEIDWKLGYEFNPIETLTTVQRQANMAPLVKGGVHMHSPDVYNLIWDIKVSPSDLSSQGDIAGYTELLTRIQLKSLIGAISMDENRKRYTMNISDAFDTAFPATYYNWKPPVSKFVATPPGETNWVEWVQNEQRSVENQGMRFRNQDDLFLVTKVYLKILPDDFKINTSYPKTPHVYKAIVVNRSYIIYLEPIYTPFNSLPMFLGDLQDDGFDYQSFSEVEKMFPYQDVATELINTRLASAHRALGDRAVYDPNYFNEGDINTTEAAAKIPLKKSLRMEQKNISQVYQQQPYDHGSTAGIMGDVEAMMGFSRMHSGRNEFSQGMNRKGNRTLGEFQTIQGNQAVRQIRIPMRVQAMIIQPSQQHLKALIHQNIDKIDLINTRTRKLIQVDPVQLQETLIDFKISSGLQNKAMYVNPEMLIQGMQMVASSPELQARFELPEWFAYSMTMGGLPDVEQFIREPTPEQAAQAQSAEGAPAPESAPPAAPAPGAPE